MKTFTQEEFMKMYGQEALLNFGEPFQEQPKGFFERAGAQIKKAGQSAQEQIAGEGQYAGQSNIRRGVGAFATTFSTPLKVGYEALPQKGREALSATGEKIGEGFKKVTEKIGDTELFTEAAMSGETGALEDVLGTVASTGQVAGDILAYQGVAGATQKATDLTRKSFSNIAEKGTDLSKMVAKRARVGVGSQPAKIMQRVARISKGKQAKFKQMAGEDVGEYLTKRGIFGSVEEISSKLWERFTRSKTTADKALETLKGTFEPAPVKTMLEELLARESRVSTQGAPSPNLDRVQQLAQKMGREGWNMSEINEIKRLFERNVKVDYLKQNLPESIARATNLDTAVRKWQLAQAKTLGLKNLDVINKETQLAKQLMDELGREYSGRLGNNAITLTDWIMLSGGDPAAISAFLIKKGFSSEVVRAAIAKALNKGKPVMGDVKADLRPSQIPQLPAGQHGAPQSQINIPINHPSRKVIESGTEIVPRNTKPR